MTLLTFSNRLNSYKVFLKRSTLAAKATEIVIADMIINVLEKTVVRNGVAINLTAKEYTLLELLASNQGRVVSKQEIMSTVWGLNFDTRTNTLEVFISYLRSKIDKLFAPKLIHTKPGFGYYIHENTN